MFANFTSIDLFKNATKAALQSCFTSNLPEYLGRASRNKYCMYLSPFILSNKQYKQLMGRQLKIDPGIFCEPSLKNGPFRPSQTKTNSRRRRG